ncbi:MAG: 1,6-anhydro-N-acetylmuramyl-L-alanine amidase AmpD [Rhodoferax sp.]|uniref:1,6-anhydro-N-acetylmuramyl-L-alanine amidase AmpD n=1 Tax=Rhodoferax sp. TaxID=50421 RepID=UPI0018001AC1|nr:1,6-anhydro-N-acetylmuramyl-L-alanine amidase AmpD [Rhodoferax sp.]NMM13644.1 1,6-anhydro-N-acetylmuramyl-L-alanine amidase AmpD [Rhodoferax sp.]NMM20539.1 1,6-anhydro-N-acetylmuramyl-L-alanine amidase AmpD [Rhodoferax sp.]
MTSPEPLHPTPLWLDGWYQFSGRLVSPNFGPRPRGTHVDLIVLHCISLPPGQYGGDEVQRLFTNQLDWRQHPYFESIEGMKVSAHFYIRRNGDLQQFVSANDRAWHAGASSYRQRSNCNDNSIGIELEGVAGDRFEDSQYETLAGLCAAILQRYPITQIAGHEHIAPGRKTDPGNGFNWRLLQRSLGLASPYFPDGLL